MRCVRPTPLRRTSVLCVLLCAPVRSVLREKPAAAARFPRVCLRFTLLPKPSRIAERAELSLRLCVAPAVALAAQEGAFWRAASGERCTSRSSRGGRVRPAAAPASGSAAATVRNDRVQRARYRRQQAGEPLLPSPACRSPPAGCAQRKQKQRALRRKRGRRKRRHRARQCGSIVGAWAKRALQGVQQP